MNNTNPNSKKRDFQQVNQTHQKDANQLFGGDDDALPAGYNPDEAFVDDDIVGDEDNDNLVSASEGSGDDLDENLEK
jgi:hypothetical protein